MCRLRLIRHFLFPSQDLAAIPDFQSGAMENWGLTTYRESSLLFDAEKSSVSSKLGITMVVSHELAHQVYELNHTFQKSINYVFIALLGHRLFILIYEFYGFIFTFVFFSQRKMYVFKNIRYHVFKIHIEKFFFLHWKKISFINMLTFTYWHYTCRIYFLLNVWCLWPCR